MVVGERPWGPHDPNSAHQLWSRWVFTILSTDPRRQPPMREVLENFRRWARLGFRSSVGRARCDAIRDNRREVTRYRLTLEIEGPPAHDTNYRQHVQLQFSEHFVGRGFGPSARLQRMDVAILAGDVQDGRPPAQVIVLPRLRIRRKGGVTVN